MLFLIRLDLGSLGVHLDKLLLILHHSLDEVEFRLAERALVDVSSPTRDALIAINMAAVDYPIFTHLSIANVAELVLVIAVSLELLFLSYLNVPHFVCCAEIVDLLTYKSTGKEHCCGCRVLVLFRPRSRRSTSSGSSPV